MPLHCRHPTLLAEIDSLVTKLLLDHGVLCITNMAATTCVASADSQTAAFGFVQIQFLDTRISTACFPTICKSERAIVAA
jgi:hypothetical protein